VSAETRITAGPGETATVGRHSGVSLRIDDALVSREHLRIRQVDGRWIVEDTGSSNGTYVDGERVQRVAVDRETTINLGAGDGPWVRLVPVARTAIDVPLTIGRSEECGLVLDDPLVSRRHARLAPLQDGWELVDLGSFNGTFVNGKRIQRQRLERHDLVGIGSAQLRFTGTGLEAVIARATVGLAAVGVSVTSSASAVLVDDVGFTLQDGSLLAVVGPSGAGKSTLLGALTGLRPAHRGSIYVNGRNLYDEYEALRRRIGFVPQDDVVHSELTVRQSLEYSAELRFPPDFSAAERRARVEEVLAELGLQERSELTIGKLSGGQRKRVSVGTELLTKPTLLFLDEPTSGLDPGLERSLMELLRSLADGGRTVVVVTHSTDSLNLCDRVLFLAPGGRTAYFGPPQLALAYFGRGDYQEVFRDVSSGSPEASKERFAADELGRRYLTEPLAGYSPGRLTVAPIAGAAGRSWLAQLSVLSRRYARVLAGDRANLIALLASAPLLGLLQLWRLPSGQFKPLPATQLRVVPQASLVLLVLAVGMTLLGLSASLREIVKEQPVVRRERSVGLSVSAYVLSKALVLGLIVSFQAVVYTAISVSLQGGPSDAVVLGWPLGELMVAGALTGLAAVALGLMCSALVDSVNAAIALLPIILIMQLLLMQGGVFDTKNKVGLHQLSYGSSAGWGFAAEASTVRLNSLQAAWNVARQVEVVDLERPQVLLEAFTHPSRGNPHWNHQSGAWARAIAALVVLTAAGLAVATFALRRFDPL
jgi:ABC transport system ATP-binding/permease protein